MRSSTSRRLKSFSIWRKSDDTLGEEAFGAEEMGQCLEGHHPDHHRVLTPHVRACSNWLGRFLSPSVSFPSVCLGVS